jgi:hypothetical protein
VGWGEVAPKLGDKYRAGKMANLLATYGYGGDRFFVRIPNHLNLGGKPSLSAYPYQVCMAFLDYYAFEAKKEAARNSLRILSEKQLPTFIYSAIGYQPSPPQPMLPPKPLRRPPAGANSRRLFQRVSCRGAGRNSRRPDGAQSGGLPPQLRHC